MIMSLIMVEEKVVKLSLLAIMTILDTLLRIFRKLNADFCRAARFLGVDSVELIGKRLI